MWGHFTDRHVCISSPSSNLIFCTWYIHNQDAIDALTISWKGMFLGVYSPLCLIPTDLQHIRHYNCQEILISPFCPRRPWYTKLLQLLVAVPLKLTVTSTTQHKNVPSIGRSTTLNYMTSIDRHFKENVFSKDTRTLPGASWRSGIKYD